MFSRIVEENSSASTKPNQKVKKKLERDLTEPLREVAKYSSSRCESDIAAGRGFVIFDVRLNDSILLRFSVFTSLLDTPTVFDVEYDSCACGN